MTKLTYHPAMDANPATDSDRTAINAAQDRVAEAMPIAGKAVLTVRHSDDYAVDLDVLDAAQRALQTYTQP
ncbi:hypothetical protein [Paraburkholderia sp. UCT2]|uniref:hypothetical protein n=1 Tax=Paraburkholderia sp. UCT2 TaxID=2615208 RepID=UPI0016558D5E|nr:hypothetical protein [Paraburkholderia sp. UCT2]MBC8728291.1 hypothetical protein [Paraburkholderia sp. UCT2]